MAFFLLPVKWLDTSKLQYSIVLLIKLPGARRIID